MIITRENCDELGRWGLLFRERRDLRKIEVTHDDLVVWFEFSHEPFPYSSLVEGSSLRDWLTACWDDMAEVCVEHARFMPCRGEDGPYGCRPSIEPGDVEAVRRYQSGS